MKTRAVITAAALALASVKADASFLKALGKIESNNNPAAVGDVGRKNRAYGLYQMRLPAVTDVNSAFGTAYRPEDALDPAKAVEMAQKYLAVVYAGFKRREGRAPNPVELARMWNGGPLGCKKESTVEYGIKFNRAYIEAKLQSDK